MPHVAQVKQKQGSCDLSQRAAWGRGAPPRVAPSWEVGLLHHNGEVEGVVVKHDAVLELRLSARCCTCSALTHVSKRRGNHRVPRASMLAATAGCCCYMGNSRGELIFVE